MSGSAPFEASAAIHGGTGGAGGDTVLQFEGYVSGGGSPYNYFGGGGGDGGAAVLLGAGNTLTIAPGGSAVGYGGGYGGQAYYRVNPDAEPTTLFLTGNFTGGNGGAGGSGVLMQAGSIVNNGGTVQAGGGAAGGDASNANNAGGFAYGTVTAGNGGEGGTGITMLGAGTLNNTSSIVAGDGGTGGDAFAGYGSGFGKGQAGQGGIGGVGVSLQAGGAVNNNGGSITGGNGGFGGSVNTAYSDGGQASTLTTGNGGAGGDGIVALAGGTVSNSGSIRGGFGGGGAAGPSPYGYGGIGGNGISGTGLTIINQTTASLIQGGGGGIGFGNATPGAGGNGIAVSNSSIVNLGTIQGGEAGGNGRERRAFVGPGPIDDGSPAGGAGIIGSNLTIVNNGTIAGGFSTDGTQQLGIVFTGGVNSLTLISPAGDTGIQGTVTAASNADTFALGDNPLAPGTGGGSFSVAEIGATGDGTSAKYLDFGFFQKTGASTWTLTDTTGYVTPWQVLGGILQISTDANLGATSGSVTVNGGTLENIASLASARQVFVGPNGGGLLTNAGTTLQLTGVVSDSATGGGLLTKSGLGTLELDSDNTYSGGTKITNGRVNIATGKGLGSGTVQMANGTTLGFLNSVTLANPIVFTGSGDPTIDTGANTDTISGAISGAGALAKAGTGTLTLTGANTYSGGTTIAAGTLAVGSAGALGSGAVAVTAGTTLGFAGNYTLANAVTLSGAGTETIDTGANAAAISGVVSGDGTLTKAGSGSLTLSGANTYSGGTVVAAGALNVASNGALGTGALQLQPGTGFGLIGNLSIGNAVTLMGTGTRTIDTGANTDTFSGVISGDGGLTKAGSGTLTLSAANTYAGGTKIAGGTLALGSAGGLGAGALSMANGTTLALLGSFTVANNIVFTNSGDPTIDTGANSDTLSGVISGPGALTKVGSGTLDLTGVSTYTGPTTVAGGTLLVDGSIANSTVTIDGGTSVGGRGTIGGLIALAGSTVAPGAGAPYSTLDVAGNVTFQAGSTFRVQVNAAGQTDALNARGTTTINGGTVDVLAGAGLYSPATRYTLLTSAGGVAGQFSALTTTSNLAFLTPTLSYGPTTVTLGFAQNAVTFPSVAITPNQQATATAIQGLGAGSPLYNAVLSQSAAGARQAFDASSGEAHASGTTAAILDSRFVSTAVLSRLWNIGGAGTDAYQVLQGFGAAPLPTMVRCYGEPDSVRPPNASNYAVWGQAVGDFGHSGGNGNASSLDRSLGGFIVGADMPVYGAGADVWRFGAAAGYSNDSFKTKSRGSTGTFESVFGTLYAGARFGAVDLRFGAGYGGNSTNMRRNVAFPGFLELERSSYGGSTVQGYGEIGYRIAYGTSVFEPIAGFTAVHVHQDGFREKGGAAALTGFAKDSDVQTTTLGFRAEVTPIADMPLVTRFMLGWQHAFGDIDPASVLAFRAGSTPFTIEGSPIDRDAAVAEALLEYRVTTNMTIGASYVGQVGAHAYDNGVKGRIDLRF